MNLSVVPTAFRPRPDNRVSTRNIIPFPLLVSNPEPSPHIAAQQDPYGKCGHAPMPEGPLHSLTLDLRAS